MSKNIGEKIKEVRLAENLTQEKFATKCGMTSKRSLGAYERKERKPEYDALQRICTVFPHYMWYLMQESMDDAPDGQITPEEKILRDLNTKVDHA